MNDHLIDNEDYFQALKTTPVVAWPTVLLMLAIFVTVGCVWYWVLNDIIEVWTGTLINCVAYYYIFSIAHDGLHRSIARDNKLNDLIAQVGMIPLTISGGSFEYFRMFHMQHHIKCGEEGLDPDIEISSKGSNAFSRWFVWGSQYNAYFKKYKNQLPRVTVKHRQIRSLIGIVVLLSLWVSLPKEMFFLWLIPTSFVAWTTAFVFSYLPHHIHKRVPGEDAMDKYQSTCNRVGMEWFMNPLTQYQNYHLVHHLYPTVPFYRYEKIWNARKTKHEARKPAVVHQFSNKPTYY